MQLISFITRLTDINYARQLNESNKKEEKERNRFAASVSRSFLSLSFSPFSFMTEKTMASLPVDFRLFQFPSSTFASGKKGRVPASGSRLVSFFIERSFAYHGLFRFCFLFYLPAYLPIYPPFRFPAPLCVHFNKDRKGFRRDTKGLLYRSVSYRVHFYVWNTTKMDVDSAQMFPDRGHF